MKRLKKWWNPSIKKRSLLWRLIEINGIITAALLILCSGLFLLAINNIMLKYVNYDIDFFLIQMADNMNSRMTYLEDTVLGVRDSEELMGYLDNQSGKTGEEIKSLFGQVVNLSADINLAEGGEPFVETVYLFKDKGTVVSTCYYSLTKADQVSGEERARRALRVFEEALRGKPGLSSDFYLEDGKGFLAYSVFDENMHQKGTIIFEINMKAIENAMKEIKNYDGYFWVIRDENEIYANGGSESVFGHMKNGSFEEARLPHNQSMDGTKYRVYHRDLSLGMKMSIGIPRNQMGTVIMGTAGFYLAGIVLIAVLAGVAYVFFSVRLTKPLTELAGRINSVKKGDFKTKLPEYDSREFNEIGTVFNEMTEYIDHLIEDGYEKQLALQQLDLKFMQSQMNPHFMFNVLNTIALQARLDGNEEVCKMMTSFAKLIQAKIYKQDREKVRIREELEYVEYYLDLQHYRYGDDLLYEINGEKDIQECYIPRLCIQTLVENAVSHGLEPKMGKGKLEVNIRKSGKDLIIEVRDDGVGFDVSDNEMVKLPISDSQKDNHNRIGLNNMNYIIRLLYGENYGISIASVKGKGTSVRVVIPEDYGGEEKRCTR